MKIARLPPVLEASARLGLPGSVNLGIGLLELACLAAYLAPRTAVLGAVLLTGFLGGAVAIHVRVGDPVASHTLFPAYVGALFWAGRRGRVGCRRRSPPATGTPVRSERRTGGVSRRCMPVWDPSPPLP